jgi:hypothetical protein
MTGRRSGASGVVGWRETCLMQEVEESGEEEEDEEARWHVAEISR